jgi:hypothetical protein
MRCPACRRCSSSAAGHLPAESKEVRLQSGSAVDPELLLWLFCCGCCRPGPNAWRQSRSNQIEVYRWNSPCSPALSQPPCRSVRSGIRKFRAERIAINQRTLVRHQHAGAFWPLRQRQPVLLLMGGCAVLPHHLRQSPGDEGWQ